MYALDDDTARGQFEQRVATTAIDFNTATMSDVVARAVVMHPSLLADALREVRARTDSSRGCASTGLREASPPTWRRSSPASS